MGGWAISNIVIRQWHRRLALVIGVLLVFQGLTGAVAQYRFWLMQATDPTTYSAPVRGSPASPEAVLDAVNAQLPGFHAMPFMYPATNSPGTAVIVMGGRSPSGRDMSRMVTVDQYQGRVIHEGPSSAGWIGLATTLHTASVFGTPGRIYLTLLGLGTFTLSIMGLTLWWRTRRMDGRARGVARIHRTAGVVVGVLLAMVSATGTTLNLVTWAEKASKVSVTAANRIGGNPADHSGHGPPVISLGRAYEVARGTIGPQRLAAFSPAGPHTRDHWFSFTDGQLKRTDILVSAKDGSVVGVYPSGTTRGGGGIRQWLFPIHSGYIIGQAGGAIMTVMGLSLSFWFVSGIIIWRRGHRARKAV